MSQDFLPMGSFTVSTLKVGNQAYQQVQNDVYGSAILTATHVFFDKRLTRSVGFGRDFHVDRTVIPVASAAMVALQDILHAVFRVGRGDEIEIGPDLRVGDVLHDGRKRRIAGIDRVRGRDDTALLLLAVDDGEAGDGDGGG